MMRIAILSDIHGNRTAFEAVLADLQQTSPDLILHGGGSCRRRCQPRGDCRSHSRSRLARCGGQHGRNAFSAGVAGGVCEPIVGASLPLGGNPSDGRRDSCHSRGRKDRLAAQAAARSDASSNGPRALQSRESLASPGTGSHRCRARIGLRTVRPANCRLRSHPLPLHSEGSKLTGSKETCRQHRQR